MSSSFQPYSWRRDGYELSTDPARLDVDAIHAFLRRSYWAAGVPREVVARSIEHSIPFGVYDAGGAQAGFARVVTDAATVAYLGDVFVLEAHRGRGLGRWLVECALAHPELRGLRRWSLATADAHELYARYGFRPLSRPGDHMAIERSPAELWGDGVTPA